MIPFLLAIFYIMQCDDLMKRAKTNIRTREENKKKSILFVMEKPTEIYYYELNVIFVQRTAVRESQWHSHDGKLNGNLTGKWARKMFENLKLHYAFNGMNSETIAVSWSYFVNRRSKQMTINEGTQMKRTYATIIISICKLKLQTFSKSSVIILNTGAFEQKIKRKKNYYWTQAIWWI